MSNPTHRCHYCSRDIIPKDIEYTDGDPGAGEWCPHCGATSLDTSGEFGVDEPWVQPLEST